MISNEFKGEEFLTSKKSREELENYWFAKFTGELTRSTFPYDSKGTVSNVRTIENIKFRFPEKIFSGLQKRFGKSEIEYYLMLMSGLTILLGKYSYTPTGNKDIVLGTPTFLKQSTPKILAIRNQFDETIPFNELVEEVKKNVYEAIEFNDFPLEALIDHLKINVFGDDFPLFDVALSFENIQDRRSILFHNVNVVFSFFKTEQYIDGVIEYNASLYEQETIKKIIDQYMHLLQSILSDIHMPLYALEIFSPEEKIQLIKDLNKTDADYPRAQTIQDIFEFQVVRNSDRIALIFHDQQVTYRELNERINRLAHELRKKGLKTDQFAGLMVERSAEMIIGMLGILKAGGAYLPIDPEYPQDRILYLLKDSHSRFLLTQKKFIGKLGFEGEIIRMDTGSGFGNRMNDENESTNPEVVNKPHDLAYAIYTSGSTGKPKGVLIEHGAVINLAYSQKNTFKIEQTDHVLQFSSVSFDASVEQIYITLFSGAALVLIDKTTLLDMKKFEKFIDDHTLAHIHAVPLFVSNIPVKKYSGLKRMIAGGDVCPASLIQQWTSHCDFCNEYGPTETTVTSIQLLVKKDEQFNALSIGQPLNNTLLFILGRNLELVPFGVPGELCIGGDGVARGYLNRPELTAEKFIGHEENKTQLYRTGDLARWLPDGNIDFLGRIDFQVKIRGFRIETGEIENQLLAQPEQRIKEAVVIAREDPGGEKYLCAYLVSDQLLDIPALTRTISKNLPDYMIPSYFVQIEKFPLTPTGKMDRKALPDPQIQARSQNYIAPRNKVEEALVAIWSELLHMKKDIVSIDGNFFRLGGHSLKASVMITLIHKTLNVRLKLLDIFNMPTIRELAEYIGSRSEETYSAIPKAREKQYYPQTSMQKRLYFIDQLKKKNTVYNIQMMDVYCKGIDKHGLEEAFRKLIERHESLRTTFHTIDGEAVQAVHTYEAVGANFKIEYWETAEDGMIYSEEPGKEWTRVTGLPFQEVLEHFVRPFDLDKAPILRAGLIKVWGNTQILMIDMHHIMSDGISMVLLIKDLWSFYEGENLPPLPVQYRDFAEWMNSDEKKQEIKKQEPFWLKEFADKITPLNLPLDYSRPLTLTFEGNAVFFEITREETQRVYELAQRNNLTIYMLLLTAYNILLAKVCGQEEVVLGTVTGGRDHADIQNLIGMFVGTLALRHYPAKNKTIRGFLDEVKKRTLAAFENQNYPFEELVRQVAPNHDRNRNPLFDVAFGLENVADRSEEYLLEVLLLDPSSPYKFNVKKSKFDLMLIGVETENELQFTIEYSTQLFKQETVERFGLYYKKIISAICAAIDQEIGDIDIISAIEKNQILYEFNATETEYPTDITVFELFENCVEKYPDHIGIAYHTENLTYRTINAKANQLARVLRGKGVSPNHLVGIMSERSLEMIIGIFGILKSGGAYLPIDPNYPEDRIRYLFKDSGSQLLLTQGKHVPFAASIHFSGEILNLEDPGLYLANDPNLPLVNSSEDLAYIIYTSGSTGKPKGVMIEHASAVNLLLALDAMYPLNPCDAYLLKTAFLFDVSVSEILGWFWRGGRLVILQQGGEKNPLMMMDVIEHERITHLNFVPSLFNAFLSMLDEQNISKLSSLKYIFLAGEAIWPDSITRFRSLNSTIIIDNLYGPTESTVYASWYPVAQWEECGSIPIGKPVDNLKLYILNSDHPGRPRLQPIGIAGELTISGIGLARGYLNRPELTAEKFVTNPYGSAAGNDKHFGRIYHTGDLTRWTADGNVEYMGRIDFQVKVRGFRIELGEIESQLSKIDTVKEAIVVVKGNKDEDKYLCAYLLSSEKLDMSFIRETLSQNLPHYMIPSYFIQIEKVPLNPSGKLDRKALPEPEISAITQEYCPPRNAFEATLAEVWSEVLTIEKIGIDDNFFEIGGDSIKTILISARLIKHGITINVNDFFSFPTIRKLADHSLKDHSLKGSSMEHGDRNLELIFQNVEQEYQEYLKKVDDETWPDLNTKSDDTQLLITGATGYLGAHLAYEMLQFTDATLYLPVRGRTQAEAEKRLMDQLGFYFGPEFVNAYKRRIVAIKADLREENLGMSQDQYDQLCETIQAVIHSAANVKHFGLYEEFYKDNVESTVHLLDFSLKKTHKPFHYISTLDTGRGDIEGQDYLLFTEYASNMGQKMEEVYLKSKIEAERQTLAYRDQGLDTSIYRAANMTFHSQTGRFQQNIETNFFYSMLKAFIKIGFWSESMMDIAFDLSFINEAARAIALLSTRKNLNNQIYHICNPHTLTWHTMSELFREIGIDHPNAVLTPEQVAKRLSDYKHNIDDEKIIERVNVYAWEWEGKNGTLTVPKMDRTVKLLKTIGFEWSKIDKEHIEKMITYCKKIFFL